MGQISRHRFAALVLGLALVTAGCGDDAQSDDARSDEAVEAREQNAVSLGGLEYRVPIFRQLNPRIAPDRALYDGPSPSADSGVFAAFIRVCNEDGPRATPTGRIFLEDAFGERFYPVEQPENERAYAPEPLAASECLPGADDPAATDGAPLAFLVPLSDTRERPMVLVIDGAQDDARIELDL